MGKDALRKGAKRVLESNNQLEHQLLVHQFMKQSLIKRSMVLPDDIIRALIQYLNFEEQYEMLIVSREWFHVISSMWSSLRDLTLKRALPIHIFKVITHSSSQQLLYVNMTGWSELDDLGIKILIQNCPQIVNLNLSKNMHITKNAIIGILTQLIELKTLDVSFCTAIEGDSDKEWDFNLGGRKLQLEYLDVSFTRIVGSSFRSLVKACPRLRKLFIRRTFANNLCSLKKCTFCARPNVHMGYCSKCRRTPYCSRKCQAADWNKTPRNHKIICNLIQKRLSLLNQDIGLLVVSCPKLEVLDLSGNREIDNYAMLMLGLSCPELQELRLSRCWRISAGGLITLVVRCVKIRSLHVCGSTKRSQSFLSPHENDLIRQHAPNLKEFCTLQVSRSEDEEELEEDVQPIIFDDSFYPTVDTAMFAFEA